MISRKFIKLHKKSLSLLLFCFAAACIPLLAAAQSSPPASQPSPSTRPEVVQQCGYTLRKHSVAFPPGPALNFTFSIERDNKSTYDALTEGGIEAFHDKDKLRINPSDLKNQTNVSVGAMVLVDVSQSMRRKEFRKLDAVKKGLKSLVDSSDLRDGDSLAIVKFDNSPQMLQSATSNRNYLYRAIDALNGKNGTRLYDSIIRCINQARQDGLHNLIVLSDGVDGSPEAVRYRSTKQRDKLLAFEHMKEEEIIRLAREYEVQIFAVEMGNTSEAYPSMYVYRGSLARLSNKTWGGDDYYIDLLQLRRSSDYDKGLGDQLSAVLEQIRKTYNYDYALRLPLAGRVQADGKPHTITINFKFDRCTLPVEIEYAWYPGESAPQVITYKPGPPLFIEPYSTAGGNHGNLLEITRIYLLMMVALGLLSGVPLAGQRLAEGRETRQIRRAILTVGKGSPYLGKECPSEGSFRRIREGDVLLICPASDCKLPHHLDCWHQAGGRCYRRNCSFSSHPRPLPELLAKRHKLSPGS